MISGRGRVPRGLGRRKWTVEETVAGRFTATPTQRPRRSRRAARRVGRPPSQTWAALDACATEPEEVEWEKSREADARRRGRVAGGEKEHTTALGPVRSKTRSSATKAARPGFRKARGGARSRSRGSGARKRNQKKEAGGSLEAIVPRQDPAAKRNPCRRPPDRRTSGRRHLRKGFGDLLRRGTRHAPRRRRG